MHIVGGCDNLHDYVCSVELIMLRYYVQCDPPVALVNGDTTLKFIKISLLCSVMLVVDCFGPRPIASEVQVGGRQPLQIWQHSLGIFKISNTDMQITNELCEDSITKPVYKKSTVANESTSSK
jgi:hypothetical protein